MPVTHNIIIILGFLMCARNHAINLGNNELAKAIEGLAQVAQNADAAEVGHTELEYIQSDLGQDMCENQNMNRMSDVLAVTMTLQSYLS